MKSKSLIGLALLICITCHVYALPQAVQQQFKNAQPLGSGRLTLMFVDIYDASLYNANPAFDPNYAFALRLDYWVAIKGAAIADHTIAEIKKQRFEDAAKLAQWREALGRILPNVKKGTSLTGFRDSLGRTQFYHNEQWIGEISDPQFAEYFFAIWLAEGSSEPKLRRQLLGTP